MKTNRIYLSFILICCVTLLYAYPVETVVLQDGSVLEGYMSVQRPGKDIVFVAQKATIYVPSDKVVSIVRHETEVDKLSEQWKEWVKDNPNAVETLQGKKYLTLSDIVLEKTDANKDSVAMEHPRKIGANGTVWNVTPRKVRIVEKGAIVKYLDFAPNTYYLSWKDIRSIKRPVRGKTELSGTVDKIELHSDEILSGQIIEQVPGKFIRLLKDDGMVEVISSDKIVTQKKVKLNKTQRLIEQVPYIEILYAKPGKVVRGVLIEQNYGTKQTEGYVLFQQENDEILKCYSGDITEIRKEKNEAYAPLDDIIVRQDEFFVNRQKVNMMDVDERDSFLMLDVEGKPVVLKQDSIGGKLILETYDDMSNRECILLKLVQMKVKGKIRYVFTYEDLVQRSVRPSGVSVSANHTLKLEYPVSTGEYVIYKPQGKKVIWCKIE